MKKFHYSAYWRRWSRRLSDSHPMGPYVDVNLTPIESWDEVRSVSFRFHGTRPDHLRDLETDELPEFVSEIMKKNLGPELTDRLLNGDLLPQLNRGPVEVVTGVVKSVLSMFG